MNLDQTIALVAFVQAIRPTQDMDDMTPKAWQWVLADVDIDAAREAVLDIARREKWIDPSEIVKTVRRSRRDRLKAVGDDLAPNVDPDDVTAWVAELRALRTAVAHGRVTPEQLGQYSRGELPTLTGVPAHIGPGQQLIKRDMRALGRVKQCD